MKAILGTLLRFNVYDALPYMGVVLVVGVVLVLGKLARRSPLWYKVFIVISCSITSFYFLWRLLFTLSFVSVFSAIFSTLLLLAETIGLFASFMFCVLFAKPIQAEILPEEDQDFAPSVDILISTYNEDLEMVMANALAAQGLPYENKKVYVCDDGRRSRLKELCDYYGFGYITREDNAHGKAGNINNALSQTSGELVLLLDADFIVKEGIIKTALPYFKNPKVAMVQYPQTFYNKDPFQMLSRRFYNEQDFFMRYMEPRLSTYNAMIHVGTNALIRRFALEKIGGIPTESIAEDMATSMLLQNSGWKTQFINKAFAIGVAPFRLMDLANQRSRWARGVMQNFAAHNPLRMKNLTKVQKLLYVNGLVYWFTSFSKLLYIIMPTLFMIFGIAIVHMTMTQIVTITVPVIFMQMVSFHVLVGKVRSFDESHVYDILVAPYHATAILKELFHREKDFHVTPKDIGAQKSFDFRGVAPHLAMIVWLLVAMACSIFKLVQGTAHPAAQYVCMFWTVYNLYGLFYCLRTAAPHKIQTAGRAMSVPINEVLEYDGGPLVASEISYGGFLAKKADRLNFEEGREYAFTVKRTGLVVSAVYRGCPGTHLEFDFALLEPKAALRVARFYSREMHAAKVVDFDIGDVASGVNSATVWHAKKRKAGRVRKNSQD